MDKIYKREKGIYSRVFVFCIKKRSSLFTFSGEVWIFLYWFLNTNFGGALQPLQNADLFLFVPAHFFVKILKCAVFFGMLSKDAIKIHKDVFWLDAKFLFAFRASNEKQICFFFSHNMLIYFLYRPWRRGETAIKFYI